jgi:hypothetical protein
MANTVYERNGRVNGPGGEGRLRDAKRSRNVARAYKNKYEWFKQAGEWLQNEVANGTALARVHRKNTGAGVPY